jgi:hypothetical protein
VVLETWVDQVNKDLRAHKEHKENPVMMDHKDLWVYQGRMVKL